MASRFAITRHDGRSDTQIVCDVVAAAAPGDLLSYQTLRHALAHAGRDFAADDAVGAAVRRAIPKMLRLHQRVVHAVPREGYRVAEAAQHLHLADSRRTRARRQMALGVAVLKGVRWDELDPNQRAAHEGQLLIMSAMHQATQALERRQARVEALLSTLTTSAS